MVSSSLILIIEIDSSMSVLQKKSDSTKPCTRRRKNNYQTHKFHRLPKICHSGVSWVEPRATLSHIKKMQRKASGAKAAYVRLLASLCVIAAARRWLLWPGAKAGFEKIGSHPDANGEHLFQKVKARKLVPPNLGLPTTAAASAARHVRERLRRHMRRQRRLNW